MSTAAVALASLRSQEIDKRFWPLMALIGLFGFLVVKEVQIPSSLLATFAGLGLVVLLFLGLRSPELCLYVLIAYIPFSGVLVGDFGTQAIAFNLTNVLTAAVLIAHALRQTARNQPVLQGAPMNNVVLLFALLGAVSLAHAGWTYGSWYVIELVTSLKRWLTPIFFYFLTFWIVRDRRTLNTIIVLIMVAVTMVGMMAVWDYMQVGPNTSLEHSRIGAITDNPNTLGAFFNYYMFLIVGFFLTLRKSRLRTWLLLIPILICMRGIMVTFSRGAYLAFAVAALAACWFRSKILFAVAVVALALAVANPMILPSGVRYRLGQTVESGHLSRLSEEPLEESLEASAANRIAIWKGALAMIREHPMWGVGYGAFPYRIGSYTEDRQRGRDAHNSYLLIAAEMGIPTLLVFLLVLAVAGRYFGWLHTHAKDPFLKATSLGLLAGLWGLLVANLFGSRMDDQAVSSYFWVLCGLAMRAVVLERQARRGAGGRPAPASVLGGPGRRGAGVKLA